MKWQSVRAYLLLVFFLIHAEAECHLFVLSREFKTFLPAPRGEMSERRARPTGQGR
jgi:hypothetical protein